MTIADRIKYCRESLSLTQEELAKKMNYAGKSGVSRAETSGDNIGGNRVQAFADALGVSAAFLFGWTNETSNEMIPNLPDTTPPPNYVYVTEDEFNIIAKIMLLNDTNKSLLFTMLDSMIESQKKS